MEHLIELLIATAKQHNRMIGESRGMELMAIAILKYLDGEPKMLEFLSACKPGK